MKKLYYQIGERIAELRKEQKMTQEDLAEQLDVSVKHVSEVERGIAYLSLEKLILACDILSTDMDYLARGIDRRDGSQKEIPGYVTTLFEESSENQQELLKEYLRMYRKIQNSKES